MNNLSLESRSWNAFFIEDIAEIVSGRDIYEKERLDDLCHILQLLRITMA